MGSLFVIAVWWMIGAFDSYHTFRLAKPVTLNTFLRRYGMKGTEHYKKMPPAIWVLAAVIGVAGLFADEATRKFIKGIK